MNTVQFNFLVEINWFSSFLALLLSILLFPSLVFQEHFSLMSILLGLVFVDIHIFIMFLFLITFWV